MFNVDELVQKKVTVEMDTKIPNAATVIIAKEGHTLGNLLRYQLLENPRVTFAGYKVPHPLKYEVHIKVQTTGMDYPPQHAVNDAIELLVGKFANLTGQFEREFTNHSMQYGGGNY